MREDIRRVGAVTDPLMILRDGRVINGRTRLRHAQALKLPAVPVRVLRTPLTDLEVELLSIRFALGIRNLLPTQLFGVFHMMRELLDERETAARRPRGRPRLSLTPVSAKLHQNQKGTRSKQLDAQVMGVSPRTAAKFLAISLKGSPDLVKQVMEHKVSVYEAYRAQNDERDRAAPRGIPPPSKDPGRAAD